MGSHLLAVVFRGFSFLLYLSLHFRCFRVVGSEILAPQARSNRENVARDNLAEHRLDEQEWSAVRDSSYGEMVVVECSSNHGIDGIYSNKRKAFREEMRGDGNHLALSSLYEQAQHSSYGGRATIQQKSGPLDYPQLLKDRPFNDGTEDFHNHPARFAMPPSTTIGACLKAYCRDRRSLFGLHIPPPHLSILLQHSDTNVPINSFLTPTPQPSDTNVPITSSITPKFSPAPTSTESSPKATLAPPGASSNVEAVRTAVVVTAAVTLTLAGIVFYFYQKFRPSASLENSVRPKDDKPLLDNSSQSNSSQSRSRWLFSEKPKENCLNAISSLQDQTAAMCNNTTDVTATYEKKDSNIGIMCISGSGMKVPKFFDDVATNDKDPGLRMNAETIRNKYHANSLPASLAAEIIDASLLNSISKKIKMAASSATNSSEIATIPSVGPFQSQAEPIPSSTALTPAHSTIPVSLSPPSPPSSMHINAPLPRLPSARTDSSSQVVSQPPRLSASPSSSSKLPSWPPLLPARGPPVPPPPPLPRLETASTTFTSKLPPWPPLPTTRALTVLSPPPETAATSTSKLPLWPPLPIARGPPVPPTPPLPQGTIPHPPAPPPGARPPAPPPPLPVAKGSVSVPGLKGSSTTTLPGAKGTAFTDLPPLKPSMPPKLPSNTGKTNASKGNNAKPKLKPLHWDKVKADASHSMVWDKLRTGSFELNEETIENLFGYNVNATFKDAGKPGKFPVPVKKPTILDAKKAQNIAIQLRALDLRKEDVCDALLEGDGLSCELLEVLVKMAPTQEEQKRLQTFIGNASELGPAERFLKALLEVPFAFERLKAMLFKACFKDDVVHAQGCLQTLEVACTDVRNSRLFLKLLEAVLKTGNRMNAGTFRGEANAFKLDALLRLSDIKSADGKTTLLHFVVEEIIKAEGVRTVRIKSETNVLSETQKSDDAYKSIGLHVLLSLSSELGSIRKAAGIDADALNQSVSKIVSGLDYIKETVQTQFEAQSLSAESFTAEDNFLQHMVLFLKQAEQDVNNIQTELGRVMDKVKQVTAYYHGNLRETQPLRLFMIVSEFLRMLERVCADVAKASKLNLTYDNKL